MPNTHQPDAAIVNPVPNKTFHANGEQISGFGQPGSSVTLLDNNAPIGSASVAADGTWASSPTLPGFFNSFVGEDLGPTGKTGITNTASPVFEAPNPLAPDVSFDPDVSFEDGSTALISGKAYNTAAVNLYNNGAFQGSVGVNAATHEWSYVLSGGTGEHSLADIQAVAGGDVEKSPYTLITGITGHHPYAAQQTLTSPDGTKENIAYSDSSGRLLFDSSVELDAANHAKAVITGSGGGVEFAYLHDQSDSITNFKVSGPGHSYLDMAGSGLNSRTAVLGHSVTSGGNTTIHVPGGDSITLEHVTKAQLHAHAQDIVFS